MRRNRGVAVAACAVGLAATGAAIAVGARSTSDPPHGTGGESFVAQVTGGMPGGADDATSRRMPLMSELPARGSYVFASGTGYRDAITALYLARQRGDALPAGVTRGDALPAGKVVVTGGDGSLAVDAAAPIGYDPASGLVQDAGYSLPGSLSGDEVEARRREARANGWALPRGASVIVPPLPRCEVLLRGETLATNPACGTAGADTRRVAVP